ncbi:MAG TPA: DUF5011 domain-containing protein, partial [Acidimicrobiales bacterium]
AYAAVNASASGPAPDAAGATLSTDKTDYQPGETVVFTGSGFSPYEQVRIVLKEDPARHPDTTLTSTADERGAVLNKDYSPTEENLGTSYTATATGQESGRTAVVRFTDGGNFSYSPNPLAPVNVTSGAAPLVLTRTVNITSPNANNGAFTADVSVTRPPGMPASVTTALSSPSFLPSTNRLSYTASNQTRAVTLTVTVPAGAATGSYLVNVVATQSPALPQPNQVGQGSGASLSVGITNDQSAPDTTAAAAAAGDDYIFNTWTNKNVKVTLSAVDSGTGVDKTFYKVCASNDTCNLVAYSEYPNGGINLNSPDPLYTVWFFSTDLAGNAENPKSVIVRIDKTSPVVTLDGAGVMTLIYGDTYTEPGAAATDAGGSGLAGPVSVTGAVNTLAVGDYAVSYNVSDNAGNAADTVTRTVHVVKADPTVNVSGYSVTYDGSAHTATGAATGVFGEPLAGLDLGGTTHTGAGTYDDAWTFTDTTGNYNDAAGTVSDSIAKAPTTTTVTCGAGPFTYDGAAHTPCTASAAGPGGLSQTLAVNYADNVNAGTATASAAYPEADNYLGSSDSETFEIGKAESVTTVTCAAGPFSYDGTAQTPCAAAVTGAGGLNQTLAVNYSNNVNAGTASAAAGYDGDANHTGSSDAKTFEIAKAATTTAVACGAGPFTYNGSAHTPCTAAVSGPGGLSQTLAVGYLNNVNAGTATASAVYAGAANYLPSSDSENFNINRADAVITVNGYTGFYDGSAHGATGTASGVLGEDLSGLLDLGAKFTNVPGGTAAWTFNAANANTNYNAAGGSAAVVIKPWTLRGFYSPVQMSGGAVVWNNIKGGQT